jgi:endoglucanase
LNVPLLTALGFNLPPQTDYVQKPDTTQFDLYSDFVGENIKNASSSNGTLDFYNSENPSDGKFCIYWNGAQRYGTISFDFMPNKDLSVLKNEGYVFNCMIKGNIPYTSFDIRFIDSKTSASDHPWRMGVRINNSIITLTSEWQNLQIPLNNFYEFGSWDNNTWYNPMGLFDWKDIDRFEIVAEDSSLVFSKLWFDEIKIFNPNILIVAENQLLPTSFELKQNYPNPFNPSTMIQFQLPASAFVTLKVYNILGREVAVLLNETKEAGQHEIKFSNVNLPSGVYVYMLDSENFNSVRKMMLVK